MYLKTAYHCGVEPALVKLGTAAGPIAYAPRDTQENHTLSDKNMQLAWLGADREPAVTGEESGIGMPSPGKEASWKRAGLGDGGYAAFSNGEYGSGSVDANRVLPDREQRLSNNIDRAFVTNEKIDSSTGPEPATTQPQGSKYASMLKQAIGSAMGIGGGLRNAGMGSAKSMMGAGGTPGLQAPKPPRAVDPRADKPPGMNLQNAIQTTSGVSDMGASMSSRFRRLDGNPM